MKNAKQWSFSFAYSFAFGVVAAVKSLYGTEDYLIDFVDPESDEFLGRIAKPDKDTLLHIFIRNLNYSDWEWYVRHAGEEVYKEFAQLVADSGAPVPEWLKQGDVDAHLDDAYDLLEQVSGLISDIAFHLLYADRDFLFHFQRLLNSHVTGMRKKDYPDILKADGVIKRPKRLPSWLRNAVFHRDKGHCQLCFRDLTGLLTPQQAREVQLDHMIPLADGGTNDPTNFQLVCARCNQKKQGRCIVTRPKTFPYW